MKYRIDHDACIQCDRCPERCPAEAIECRDSRYYINNNLCIGCGECVAICPADAVKPA